VTEVSAAFLTQFLRATAVLALPADSQKLWLSSLGLPGQPLYADELAMEFDDGVRLLDQFVSSGWLKGAAADRLRVLDGLLTEMSGSENAELWTLEALESSPRWEAVRASARSALLEM
jgi:hypothetical protein